VRSATVFRLKYRLRNGDLVRILRKETNQEGAFAFVEKIDVNRDPSMQRRPNRLIQGYILQRHIRERFSSPRKSNPLFRTVPYFELYEFVNHVPTFFFY
jgi:hypothetical protein